MPKIRSICIDTITAIQQNQYMEDIRKPGHDQWMDYGKAIYTFVDDLMKLGFEIIYILGEPGTGKSSGMRTLEHETNMLYNTDNKNPVWIGGKEEYGKKNNPTKFHIIPKTYTEIIKHVCLIRDAGALEQDKYAFLLGHTESYKVGNDTKERLKTLGKVATKMQLEGKAENVFYSRVQMEGGTPTFMLETQNDGFNTARSTMGLFEGKISNDYQLVIDKLLTY